MTNEDQRMGGAKGGRTRQREEPGVSQVRRCQCSVGVARGGGAERGRKKTRKEGRNR